MFVDVEVVIKNYGQTISNLEILHHNVTLNYEIVSKKLFNDKIDHGPHKIKLCEERPW